MNTPPVWKEDEKNRYFIVGHFDEDVDSKYIKLRDKGLDATFYQHIEHVINSHIGSWFNAGSNGTYGVTELAMHKDDLRTGLEELNKSVARNRDSIRFFEILDAEMKRINDIIASRTSRGMAEFGDIPFIFKKGDEVIFVGGEDKVAGVVEGVRPIRSWSGTFMQVKMRVLHGVKGEIADGIFNALIPAFRGLSRIDDFVVRHITVQEKQALSERGKIFASVMTGGVHYMAYTGQLVRHSWSGAKAYRSDGRVMIDVNTFRRVDADGFRNEQSFSGIEGMRGYDDDDDIIAASSVDLDALGSNLWRAMPYVYGFSFAAKKWGRLSTEGLRPIQWREDAFEKLVLPDEEKGMVRALVENHVGSFEDIVEGKGGGCIFLLHGEPGQGKTLTAETVAEVLKRPLYSISVGELGTDPDVLESRLRGILDIATTWNAVLLLDEADIFLEARDEHDIVRNAMVGVFLRLLEYHQGVLFLTTNRVRNIDPAFYSRISVAMRFDGADFNKRVAIWNNLLEAAGITGLPVDVLAQNDINGRQIKNTIRLAQTLARAAGEKVGLEHIERTIAISTKFQEDMRRQKAAVANPWAKDSWNVTEQVVLLKSDLGAAQRLMIEAGYFKAA